MKISKREYIYISDCESLEKLGKVVEDKIKKGYVLSTNPDYRKCGNKITWEISMRKDEEEEVIW